MKTDKRIQEIKEIGFSGYKYNNGKTFTVLGFARKGKKIDKNFIEVIESGKSESFVTDLTKFRFQILCGIETF